MKQRQGNLFFVVLSLLSFSSLKAEFNNEDFSVEFVELAEYRSGCDKLTPILNKACQIEATVTVFDFSGVYTAIEANTELFCEKFEQTWTILAAIEQNQEIVDENQFAQTFTAIVQVTEILCGKFQQTWTILGCSAPIPVTQPTTIANSGNYIVTTTINGAIIIAADQVSLDLNQHKITGASPDNISISGQSDITIFNGTIQNATTNGIDIANCTNVKIIDIDFVSNVTAINVLTTTCLKIENCTFSAQTGGGIFIDNTNSIAINSCKFNINSCSTMLSLEDSLCINCNDVAICFNGTLSSTIPFLPIVARRINNALFSNCKITSNNFSSNLAQVWRGFTFESSSNIALQKCSISTNPATAGGTNNFIGIAFEPTCQNVALDGIDIVANTVSLSFTAIRADSLSNARLYNIFIDSNSVTNGSNTGLYFNNCQDITGEGLVVSSNVATNQITGYEAFASNKCMLRNAEFNNNRTTGVFDSRGIYFSGCNNIILQTVQAQDNATTGSTEGITFDSCNQVVLNSSITNNNVGNNSSIGVRIVDGCSDILLDNCVSSSNCGLLSSSTTRGFLAENSTKIIFNYCVAMDNGGAGIVRGFDVRNTTTSCILNCTAVGELSTAIAIELDSCAEIIVQNYSASFLGLGINVNNTANAIIKDSNFITGPSGNVGMNLVDSNRIIIEGNSVKGHSRGLEFTRSSTNTIQGNIFDNNSFSGVRVNTVDSVENFFFKNIANFNTLSVGFIDAASNLNTYFLNKAQQNGSDFSSIAPVAIFDMSTGAFVTTTTSPFDNLSIVP
ncbi:MAG: right-handed parallel beta-helix repeat-containing protein [Candidatus Babeliales bacterium]